ncbi:hypothetical protein [Hutsoniella sourekii]|uniref:hypothetical protein n=1 Tax=Hutsoniella sourekii TaxID=87650 RepID=UPI0004BACF7E|nr:hypothetical protein [Hutsoniella sourekii]
MPLTEQGSIKTAFELTKLAVENNFIASDNDPEKAAENVATFFRTLVSELQEQKQ